MTRVVHPGIGTQTIDATPQPKMGDREDFLVRVQGPDPSTDFQVPLSVTGTALAIWGNPNPKDTAEELTEALFRASGTASQPPSEGFWFDSYNSKETIRETANRIANEGVTPFVKNAPAALYVRSFGQEVNDKIQALDAKYTQKFSTPFFNSLEDLSEESQRVDDLNTPADTNADYLYRISILSGIIDHINVRLAPEDDHNCTECGQRHRPGEGSLQALRRWLTDKVDAREANRLTETFQKVKNLRKQYPIHDQYVTANNVRQVRNEIARANTYFGVRDQEFAHNASTVVNKFAEAIEAITEALDDIS